MNTEERDSLVDRICQGYYWETVVYNEQEYEVEFKDPPRTFIYQAKQKAAKFFRNQKDVLTKHEAEEQLISRGVWSHDKEAQLIQLDKDLKFYKSELNRHEFNEHKTEWVNKNIKTIKEKQSNLLKDKNQLIEYTIEYQKSLFIRKWLIAKTYKIMGEDSPPDSDGFLNTLVLYYWERNYPTEEQLRKLARTEPWRLIWTASKDTSTPLFSHPVCDITELQQALISWTRIYDWAFAHPERPSHEVIDDDEKFDAWYESQAEKTEKEQKTKNYKEKKGDVFIPADAAGARKVWAMNDAQTRAKIKQRIDYVNKYGEVDEANLPDVKVDLIMEANRQKFNKGKM